MAGAEAVVVDGVDGGSGLDEMSDDAWMSVDAWMSRMS